MQKLLVAIALLSHGDKIVIVPIYRIGEADSAVGYTVVWR